MSKVIIQWTDRSNCLQNHLIIKMMGAVRVKVQLKNAIDEELVNRGLLAPNLLRQIEIEGLVDTGAVGLVIP